MRPLLRRGHPPDLARPRSTRAPIRAIANLRFGRHECAHKPPVAAPAPYPLPLTNLGQPSSGADLPAAQPLAASAADNYTGGRWLPNPAARSSLAVAEPLPCAGRPPGRATLRADSNCATAWPRPPRSPAHPARAKSRPRRDRPAPTGCAAKARRENQAPRIGPRPPAAPSAGFAAPRRSPLRLGASARPCRSQCGWLAPARPPSSSNGARQSPWPGARCCRIHRGGCCIRGTL